MILLDTDHLSALKYDEHPRCRALRERMKASEDHFFATTIVSAEEQMRGLARQNSLSERRGETGRLVRSTRLAH